MSLHDALPIEYAANAILDSDKLLLPTKFYVGENNISKLDQLNPDQHDVYYGKNSVADNTIVAALFGGPALETPEYPYVVAFGLEDGILKDIDTRNFGPKFVESFTLLKSPTSYNPNQVDISQYQDQIEILELATKGITPELKAQPGWAKNRVHVFKTMLYKSYTLRGIKEIYTERMPSRDAKIAALAIAKLDYNANVLQAILDWCKYIFDLLSDEDLSMIIPMVITLNLNMRNNKLNWFLNYLQQRPVPLSVEYFTIYYPAICLVGVEFLIKIYSHNEVRQLLEAVLQRDVPEHIRDVIHMYLN